MFGPVDPGADRTAAAGRVEGRELVAAVAQDRDAEALEPLQGEPEVEDDLGARAEDRDRRAAQLFEVGGHILGMASVHAADAPCREDADAGQGRDPHGRRDGCRARFTRDQGRADVPRAELARAGRHPLQVGVGKPHPRPPVQDGDGGRHRPLPPDRRLAAAGGAQVVGRRQALAHDRGLERNHRPAVCQSVSDLVRYLQGLAHLGGLAPSCPR